MIYPIPYPSAATGPNPNSRNAGLPQFDVDRMDVLRSDQPGSVKIDGRGGFPLPFPLEEEEVLTGESGRSSYTAFSRSRWRRQ